MTSWANGKLMRSKVNEITNWQNGKLIIKQTNVMAS
jgi:hypothetical protein